MSHLSSRPFASPEACTRRAFLRTAAITGGMLFGPRLAFAQDRRRALAADADKALVAITLDMEMSRNFPVWEDTHWDYTKGNLNEPAKRYCVEAARRVKAKGGVIHFFAVGQVFEQENVDWLKEIVREGHPVGNHTYDHIYVLATKLEDIQFRFKRAPWLIAGRKPADVIRDNIQLMTDALKNRIGIAPAGFRTPGGFDPGLNGRPDVQQMLQELGFDWISCKAPRVDLGPTGAQPTRAIYDGIVKGQVAAQPLIYPNGLVDVPMAPISDVAAFRTGRWKLEWFLEAIRVGVEWAIEHRAVYDFLAHPSVLYPMDPEFKSVELICDLVKKAGHKAAIVDLDTIAARAKLTKGGVTR